MTQHMLDVLKLIEGGGLEAVLQWNELRKSDVGSAPSFARYEFRNITATCLDLSGLDIRGATFTNCSLRGCDFSESNMSHCGIVATDMGQSKFNQTSLLASRWSHSNADSCTFSNVGLDRSSFIRTSFEHCVVSDAIFDGSRFYAISVANSTYAGCWFRGCVFDKSDLRGASFETLDIFGTLYDCHFEEAQFIDCALDGTRFSAAVFDGTSLLSDFSLALSLDAIQHEGPSHVSLLALQRARELMPKAFLQGLGLSTTAIDYAWSLAATPIQFYSCFISYSTKEPDNKFAQKLHRALRQRGITCWLDKEELKPGDDLRTAFAAGIRIWDKFFFCASRNSLSSPWVREELLRAFAKEQQLYVARGHAVVGIVPIDLDGYLFSPECDSEFADLLKYRFVAKMQGWEGDESAFNAQVDKLVAVLRCDSSARPPPPKSKL